MVIFPILLVGWVPNTQIEVLVTFMVFCRVRVRIYLGTAQNSENNTVMGEINPTRD